jgi:hypothetical protein
MLKRAAAAIREARSNDTIVLAKAAPSAAIRSEVDLLELLPDPPAKPAAPPLAQHFFDETLVNGDEGAEHAASAR